MEMPFSKKRAFPFWGVSRRSAPLWTLLCRLIRLRKSFIYRNFVPLIIDEKEDNFVKNGKNNTAITSGAQCSCVF
jgi:hypothetical protein